MTHFTIPPIDAEAMARARTRQDALLKPRGALGTLELLSIRLAGMTGRSGWLPVRRAILLFAADHGAAAAHPVSTVPVAITAYMVGQFLAGKAAVNVLARQMHARLTVIDVGVRAPAAEWAATDAAGFLSARIAPGTADFTTGRAMTDEQAVRAIEVGAEAAQAAIAPGCDLLALGEMGIGSTTSASAIVAAVTGAPAAEVTGRGTGIDDAALAGKIALIERALRLHHPASSETLAKVGGLEIGAMAGAILYAASVRVPVVLDGLICTAAALIAAQIAPAVRGYLIAGHVGAEPGHAAALAHLGIDPLLTLGLRLGEGTGALLALPIIEAAARTLNEMGTLDVG